MGLFVWFGVFFFLSFCLVFRIFNSFGVGVFWFALLFGEFGSVLCLGFWFDLVVFGGFRFGWMFGVICLV